MTAEEIRAARRKSPPREVRLLLPVWGQHYVAQFLSYLLPTLLAKNNLPALAAEVPVRFIVLCSLGSVGAIRAHPTWHRLTGVCPVELKPIDDIIASSGSASTTVTLAFEREVRFLGDAMTDTAFIFLTPDYVMADGSLRSLWRHMLDGVSGIQAGNFQVIADTLKFDEIPNAQLEWTRQGRKQKVGIREEVGFRAERDAAAIREPARIYAMDPTEWDIAPDDPAIDPDAEIKPPRALRTAPPASPGVVTAAAIPPRDLAAFALNNLHPVTVSNTVNFLASHNAHTNRLFWRVDDQTLIGRFYLMHMICIRPEITDFQIGSSCDYSFIPEMCPSGNVEVITDSDEYLVIEAQPHSHELGFSRFGPLKPSSLARSLSEWTTDHHRANVRHTLVFHAGPVPESANAVKAEADAFIAAVTGKLTNLPLPTRGHPYWRHAAAYNHFFSGKEFTDEDYHALLTSVTGHRTALGQFGDRFERFVLGGRPALRPWQPDWLDYRLLAQRLAPLLTRPDQAVLLVTNHPLAYLEWAHALPARLVVSYPWHFSRRTTDEVRRWTTRFNVILVELTEADLSSRISINRIVEAAAPGAELLVIVRNQRRSHIGDFNHNFTGNVDLLQPTAATHLFVRFIRRNRLRAGLARAIEQLAVACRKHPKAMPLLLPATLLLMLLATLLNLAGALMAPLRLPRPSWSSVILGFRVGGPRDG